MIVNAQMSSQINPYGMDNMNNQQNYGSNNVSNINVPPAAANMYPVTNQINAGI